MPKAKINKKIAKTKQKLFLFVCPQPWSNDHGHLIGEEPTGIYIKERQGNAQNLSKLYSYKGYDYLTKKNDQWFTGVAALDSTTLIPLHPLLEFTFIAGVLVHKGFPSGNMTASDAKKIHLPMQFSTPGAGKMGKLYRTSACTFTGSRGSRGDPVDTFEIMAGCRKRSQSWLV